MNEDDRHAASMPMCRAASNDEAYRACALDRAHVCDDEAGDMPGNWQAEGLAHLWSAYYDDRDSDAAWRVPLDELFLPAGRRDSGLF